LEKILLGDGLKTLLRESRFSSKENPMPDKASKQPQNTPGAWYVDTTCTPCRVCLEEAPNLLKYNEDETAVYFFKQPETDDEKAAAQRAMEVCPTLAIGNDG
jgi:ferredoxin